jgi:ribonuclease III
MATPMEIKQLVETRLGYNFNDCNLMMEALKAAGSGMNLHQREHAKDGNKRLAQVGDAVIKLAFLDGWYYSETDRGIFHTY